MASGDSEAKLTWHRESEAISCMLTMSQPFQVTLYYSGVAREQYVSYYGANGQFVCGFLLWSDARAQVLTSAACVAEVGLNAKGEPVAQGEQGLHLEIVQSK